MLEDVDYNVNILLEFKMYIIEIEREMIYQQG